MSHSSDSTMPENAASQDEGGNRALGGPDDPYGTVTDPKFYDDSLEGLGGWQIDVMMTARMRMDFIEWWAEAKDEHTFYALVTESADKKPFRAWWDAEGYWTRRTGIQARIEILGLDPPQGVRLDLPDEVDTVGWWILERVTAPDACKWIEAGVSRPVLVYSLSNMLVASVEPAFEGTSLVTRNRFFRYDPTPDGFRVIRTIMCSEALQSAIIPQDLSGQVRPSRPINWYKLADAVDGDLDAALQILSDG